MELCGYDPCTKPSYPCSRKDDGRMFWWSNTPRFRPSSPNDIRAAWQTSPTCDRASQVRSHILQGQKSPALGGK